MRVAIAALALALLGATVTEANAQIPIPPAGAADSSTGGLIPTGYGTLRQDDISVKMQVQDVAVKLMPLNESVIRTLAPDSYRNVENILLGQRDALSRLAAQHNLRARDVWYVAFYGLAPDAQFTPTDVTITSASHDYRPLEIIPVTTGFGSYRVQPHGVQVALYLFDDGIEISQPLTVTMGDQHNMDWQTILQTIERERAMVRSRAAKSRE